MRAAANRARKLRIESKLKQKLGAQISCINLRIRKSARAKSSVRRFTDRAPGAVGGAECKFGEKINL